VEKKNTDNRIYSETAERIWEVLKSMYFKTFLPVMADAKRKQTPASKIKSMGVNPKIWRRYTVVRLASFCITPIRIFTKPSMIAISTKDREPDGNITISPFLKLGHD